MIYPVIMCGGSGTRLWPASRPNLPKPFLALGGGRSTFSMTVSRLAALSGCAAPIVVAGSLHARPIGDQCQELGVEPVVLIEPEGRDSAPAMAAAAAFVFENDPNGICLFLAADHHIPDAKAFARVVEVAAEAARLGHISTLGVTPTSPSPAYGYIQPGAFIGKDGAVRAVAAFLEKPDSALAGRLIEQGCLWNSGMFVASAATLLGELEAFAPEIAAGARQSVENRLTESGFFVLGDAFRSCPKISIDYAVMERTQRAVVVPATFEWSDLGSWDAILATAKKDQDGNNVSGTAILKASSGCLVHAGQGIRVAVAGARNLAIVADAGGVMVCDIDDTGNLKALVEEIFKQGDGSEEGSIGAVASRFNKWLRTNALPLWWSLGADHVQGGFHESLTHEGRPTRAVRRVRVQARQTHVFARAGISGWQGPWRQAVQHGLKVLSSDFKRSDGLYRTTVGEDREIFDVSARLYDQAFVLLALASAANAAVTPEACEAEALALLRCIHREYRHASGAWRENDQRPFQSNPLMHLFEAALAWLEAGSSQEWRNLATELADHALLRMIERHPVRIGEYFDASWAPIIDGPDAVIEPGHQFEWSWLLARWSKHSGSKDALTVAIELFGGGQKGIDQGRGVAIDALDGHGKPARLSARLWPQAERAKAAALLAELAPRHSNGFHTVAQEAGASLWKYLDSPTSGLYRDRLTIAHEFVEEPCPASSLYHIAGAIESLARLDALGVDSSMKPPTPVPGLSPLRL